MNTQNQFSSDKGVYEASNRPTRNLLNQPKGNKVPGGIYKHYPEKPANTGINSERAMDSQKLPLEKDYRFQSLVNKNNPKDGSQANAALAVPYNEIYNMVVISDFP